MAAGNMKSSRPTKIRSYLVMKAEAKAALEFAEAWWSEKEIPTYVRIKQLDIEQIEEFAEVYNRCFMTSPDPFCFLTVEQAEQLDNEGIFVAELWGDIAGFIACFVEKKPDSIYGEITGIGVLPARRRKGVATALIQKATEYFLAAGVEEIYCEVYEENTPSQMLIMAYGFREVGRRDIPIESSPDDPDLDLPGGKIMRRLGLRPRPGCKDCRDI
ncbi:MAG: GNAT family N-acetyltransferase [Promethearchaeota archaeon]